MQSSSAFRVDGNRNSTAFVWKSLLQVLTGAIIIACPVVVLDVFRDVSTDLDLNHYAERAGWAGAYLPACIPLPANTFVNIGYVVIGLLWIIRIHRVNQGLEPWNKVNKATADVCYNFYVFAWMSVIYGPVQCFRIITRSHSSAVLDQWYTLPIFAWVAVWSIDICWPVSCKMRWTFRTMTIMLVSVLLYLLALLHTLGFEIALAIHIPVVVALSWRVHMISEAVSSQERIDAYIKALLCCAGFVLLKLADHLLASQLPSLFTVFSGHFWSKVADFMQIHYVCKFFWYTLRIDQDVQANGKHSKKA
jgi:hypothetical protein